MSISTVKVKSHSISSEYRVNPKQTNTPMNNTAQTGSQPGELYRLAGKVNKSTLRRRMFELIVEKKVATLEVESEAYMLNIEKEGRLKTKKRMINWDFIRENRSWPEVEDILKLKVKYIQEQEDVYRAEYQIEKTRLLKWFKKRKKMARYRNILRKVGDTSTRRWRKGLAERKAKVEWLGKKLGGRGGKDRMPGCENKDMWFDRMATESEM